jgi:hypothetical protein
MDRYGFAVREQQRVQNLIFAGLLDDRSLMEGLHHAMNWFNA